MPRIPSPQCNLKGIILVRRTEAARIHPESFLLPVPPFGPGGNLQRPVSPLVEETEGEDGEPEPVCVGGGILKKMNTGLTTPGGPKPVHPQTSRTTANSILRKCYPSSNPQVPFLPSGHLEDCLPPCYHGAKTMAKLIKWTSRFDTF
ncbi:hypothetical protein J6590_001344 [Homalodisca vitripennis]|nr:hypothetical protein J6590_001344 [Homalodisca vitripennis]